MKVLFTRNWTRILPVVAAAAAALFLFRCGSAGETASEDPKPEPPAVTGVVDTGVKTVSGTVYIGSISTPAAGYEVWLLNHKSLTFTRAEVSDTGTFSFGLDVFPVGDIFSFHVVDHMRHAADVDVSPNVAGTQTAFTYQGGYGFVMSDLIIPVTKRGDIDRSIGAVKGSVGGGFSLRNDLTVNFDDVAPPKHTAIVKMGSQLFVFDPSTMLNSFILKNINPSSYSRDLANLSRIGISARSDTDSWFLGADVVETGAWRKSARNVDVTATNGADGALWSDSEFSLALNGKRELAASVTTGSVPVGDEMAMIRLRPSDQTAEIVTPRRIGTVIGMPPKVLAASASGATPATIDYTSASGENGLTRAFCRGGDATLDLAPPLAFDGTSLAGNFNQIDVAIDYLAVDANGHLADLKPAAAVFAAPYNAANTAGYGSDSRAVWTPATRVYSLELGASDAAAAMPRVTVPAALLLTKAEKNGVTYLRLRLVMKSTKSATASGTAFWLRVGC